MRITVKAPPGYVPDHERKGFLNGTSPSWNDVEVTTDSGEPITEVKSITLRMTESYDPIVATIEVYVSALGIVCEGEIVPVERLVWTKWSIGQPQVSPYRKYRHG